MFKLEKLVRANILSLNPYSSARDEFKGKDGIFLDANENPFGKLNRYPDPNQVELKSALSTLKNIPIENIFIGNGSDEVIDIAFRIFCNPGNDKVIICPPTYGVYEVLANINNVEIITISLKNDFQLDIGNILKSPAKIIFICSPNNPTGNSLNKVETILKNFTGIVFLDEAYIDFSTRESFINKVNKYPNLIVSQTLSKAWGLAASRVGIAYAGEEIISLYKKIKHPYNVSSANQNAAVAALQNKSVFTENLALILSQKKQLESTLSGIKTVNKIYPSDANFLLVEMTNATEVYNKLAAKKIITRNRNTLVNNCIRITIGTPEENTILINELKEINL